MTTLADLFAVKTRFHRSVDLLQDARSADALDGYILTHQAGELAQRIAEGLVTPSSERAWALTGPYGTGKSAFSLFLAGLLGNKESPLHTKALTLLRSGTHRGAAPTHLVHAYKKQPKGFLVVLLSGSRQALLPALLDGLSRGIRAFFGTKGAAREHLDEVDALSRRRSKGGMEDALCEMLSRLSADVCKAGGLGVLVVVDEFGKFLEHAAASPQRGDVFVLQRIAELAVRSGDTPIGIVTVLHQAFDRYAAALPQAVRDDWRKIQGRFQDVAFVEEPGQLLSLLGSALVKRAVTPPAMEQAANTLLELGRSLGVLLDDQVETYRKALPLHPTTAALLPGVFRSALSQNQRSLFSFLASRFDHGFAGFLEQTTAPEGELPTYRVDLLHDHLRDTMGPALLAVAESKRWAEIEHAVERIPRGAPALAARVVKAVGMLSLFGTLELRATPEVLAYCLEDRATPSKALGDAIALLEGASIIIFRRHRGGYGLWEGSDIDLDARFRIARERVLGSAALLTTLRQRARLHPMVARRHFFTTGTLRYFEVDVASVQELESTASRPMAECDGRIVHLLPTADETRAELHRAAKLATDAGRADRTLLLVSVPDNSGEILSACANLDAWREVRQLTAELAGDAVARRELAARITAAEEHLDTALAQAFGWGSRDATTRSTWFYKGHPHQYTPRALTEALSTVCDEVFSEAPRIHNELLNRRVLSSAAAAARRTLIDKMLADGHTPRLGIEGAPPELSMYVSVLVEGDLHQEPLLQTPRFARPRPNGEAHMEGVWEAIQQFLDASDGKARPLSALRQMLSAPPYGLKDGPFPVLLFAVIAAAPGEIALFEEGTFVAEISSAVVERLLRRMDHFEIARYSLDAGRRAVLHALGSALAVEEGASHPVELVKAIVRRVSHLPKFARSTRRVAGSALLVRDAILSARDPLRLVLHELPVALGLPPVERGGDATASAEFGRVYSQQLLESLGELEAAYPALLQLIEQRIATALDLSGPRATLRAELAERAKRIAGLAADLRLRAFLGRAMETQGDDREWLEGVTMVVGSRPPAEWTDGEMPRFDIGLAELRALFLRAEDLALDQQTMVPDAPGVVELMRVSLTVGGHKEQRQLLHVRATDSRAMEQVGGDIRRLLQDRFGDRREAWLAALGRTLQGLLAPTDETTTGASDPVVPMRRA